MTPWLVFLALTVLVAGIIWLISVARRQTVIPAGSPTPEEAKIHTQAQKEREKLIEQAQRFVIEAEAMSHDEILRRLNRSEPGK